MSRISRRDLIKLGAATLGATTLGACGEDSVLGQKDDGKIAADRFTEPSRDIPILFNTDVLVLGSGPAGLSAALAAAREGADTTIVERYGFFGGVITQQTMGSISWYRMAETVDAGGLLIEYESRAKAMGASLDVFGDMVTDVVNEDLAAQVYSYLDEAGFRKDGKPTYEILDTDMFKWVADTMLVESGVRPLLHCWAVEAIMEGNTIKGVLTESKSGRRAIIAKRVIDCTGDADIAHFAGASFRNTPTSELMESTLNFGMTGVNLPEVLISIFLNSMGMSDWTETGSDTSSMMAPVIIEPYVKAIEAGEITPEEGVELITYMGCYTEAGEIPDMNTVHISGIDPLNVEDLTNAEIKCRASAAKAIAALKKYQAGFQNARLRHFAPNIGIRESRKIIGEYELTEYDVKNQASFNDTIGIVPEFVDGYGTIILPTTGRYFQVPYRSMLPQGVENLLVAGRPISGDKMSFAATRGMCCCTVTGQGAGVAAAVSLKDNANLRDVDITEVQNRLQVQGVRIS